MKVAIIGSGISGLSCAYRLSKKHEVTVFEQNSYIGGHTHTVDVPQLGGSIPVDTGFIVFNDWTYPNFIELLNELKVPSQPSTMSFSVKDELSGLEYNGTSLNTLFSQRRNLFRPSFYRMIVDILRFNKEAPLILNQEKLSSQSLESYLKEHHYSQTFMDHYIIPMGSAIWSAGVDQMKKFPVGYFVRFFKNHGMLSVNHRPQWRVIKNGSKSYIPALMASFKDRVVVNAPVQSVRRYPSHVEIQVRESDKITQSHFDAVVLASHADQSLSLLSDPTAEEKRVLSAFRYQENETTLHTDISVLPQRRLAWASWNYWIPSESRQRVAVSYNMNILQSLTAQDTYIVSLNMNDQIRPEKIIKKIIYHHPIYDAAAVEAQYQWGQINGTARTFYCGAYWGYGFHEDGVVSGLRVAQHPYFSAS